MPAVMLSTDLAVRPLSLGWSARANNSLSDWALVGQSPFSIAGRFRINPELPASETEGQVLHGPMEAASVPSFAGSTETRKNTVERRDDPLYLHVDAIRRIDFSATSSYGRKA